MAKNLIPEIAKMLGVEIGEEFKIETFDYITYRFDNDGLKATCDKKPEAKPETSVKESGMFPLSASGCNFMAQTPPK